MIYTVLEYPGDVSTLRFLLYDPWDDGDQGMEFLNGVDVIPCPSSGPDR